jgi:hypothetical protein
MNAPEATGDAALVAIAESSAVVRLIAFAVRAVCAAGGQSRVVATARSARRAWFAESSIDRTRACGIGLVTAASVYVLVGVWVPPTPGWLWLVVPAMAIAMGLLFALAPSRAAATEDHR